MSLNPAVVFGYFITPFVEVLDDIVSSVTALASGAIHENNNLYLG